MYCIIDNGSSILGFQNVLHKPNDGTKAVLSRRPFLCGEGVGPGAPLTGAVRTELATEQQEKFQKRDSKIDHKNQAAKGETRL